jgi:hypothetical protein
MSWSTSHCSHFLSAAIVLVTLLSLETDSVASPLDQLTDLTGRANAIVTLTGRDNFTSEYRYNVSVRNHTPDLLIADSLVVVLEKITNLAGEDRENLQGESFLTRFEVLGQDRMADAGKPFFQIPVGGSPDLALLADSLPASARIRNKDYVSVFTPTFHVYGKKRPPPEHKQENAAKQTNQLQNQTEKLIQLLLKKGVITEEEWRKATQP